MIFNTKVQVGDKRYVVPEKISVAQFQAIHGLDPDVAIHRDLITATILGCQLKEIQDMDPEGREMTFAMAALSMSSLEKPKLKECPFPFDQLTFGQFVDLDVLTFEDINKNLVEILSILYDMDADKIADQPLEPMLGGITQWMLKRSEIYKAYSVFFGVSEEQSAEADEAAEGADIRKVWYQAIMTLAGEDFMKIGQVVDRPVNEALNFLAYMKEQAQLRALEHKRQMAKIKQH